MAGPVEAAGLPNFYSLLEPYGVTAAEGIVVEEDQAHYVYPSPVALMPDLAESDVTAPLLEEGYYVIVPLAAGLTVGENTTSASVTSLLTTSEASFSKPAGYDMATYEKEDGDIDGPFALAVDIACDSGGELIWVSSSAYLDDMYNAYSSGANVNFTMNALSQLIGESETLSIRTKSLNYNYLTISDSVSGLLQVVMIGLIPLAFLGTGIILVVRRRRAPEMTKKTRLILLGGVLAVSVGAAAAMSLSKEAREDIRESGEVVFELPADEVTAVSWTYTDEAGEEVSLAFRTDGDGWIYDGDEAFPVDGEKIGELLDRFAELRAAFVIEDVTDTAQYGLEDPVCAIGLTAGDTDYEIRVGSFSELDSQRYLTFGDGTVYLVDEDPMDVYAGRTG